MSGSAALAAEIALGCGESRPDAPEELTLDRLVVAIGTGDDRAIRELALTAARRGIPRGHLLAAAWVAPLRYGGLPSDVHAILVLPAIDRVARAGDALAVDPGRAIAWALTNSSQWCSSAPRAVVSAARSATRASLVAAIAGADLDRAEAHARGLVDQAGVETAREVLASEALLPRDDVHASIYAAQLCRIWGELSATDHVDAIAHLARYLARQPRLPISIAPIETGNRDATTGRDLAIALAADPDVPLDGVSESALFEGLALLAIDTRRRDASPTGIGVHRTTHLDAVSFLARRSAAPDRAHAIGCAVRSSARAAMGTLPITGEVRPHDRATIRADSTSAILTSASEEHAFKHWAAIDALAALVSPSTADELWRGQSIARAQ
jgi:hypothetical protein